MIESVNKLIKSFKNFIYPPKPEIPYEERHSTDEFKYVCPDDCGGCHCFTMPPCYHCIEHYVEG